MGVGFLLGSLLLLSLPATPYSRAADAALISARLHPREFS